MSEANTSWQLLKFQTPSKLHSAQEYLHRAAQFIALTGNSLLPKEADDSHSNMTWEPDLKSLVGKPIELDQTIHMALHYNKFELHVLNEAHDPLAIVPLTGQTPSQVLGWVKGVIKQFGGDASKIKRIDHYELPKHGLDDDAVFQVVNPEDHRELMRYRTDANLILEEFVDKFGGVAPINVWPHHFDTGSVIEVAKEGDKVVKSIGLGLAMADSLINELYFYVNQYDAKKDNDPSKSDLGALPGGGTWITEENWTGAILPASKIVERSTEEQQYRQVTHFFEEAVNTTLEQMGAKNMKLSIS